MCGIVGYIGPGLPDGHGNLEKMLGRIAHRGPDGSAIWQSKNNTIGFGHKRLAIIDVTAKADQPMISTDQRAVLVFNGEIYNHKELRVTLLDAGMKFQTEGSDTEVILNGYLAWGLNGLLERLIGMFAFALYDVDANQVHLVRDRVGVKPLSLYQDGGVLYFASETKGFMDLPEFTAQLDPENFFHHLSFRSLPAPRSLFKGVQKLAPAQAISVDLATGQQSTSTYWNPLLTPLQTDVTEDEARTNIEALLKSSIDYRMVADVDVGIFLSGGLDSNYILSQVAETHQGMHSFTVGYPDHPEDSEDQIARESAATYKTTHVDIGVTQDDFIENLPKIAYFQDEPISAPICVPVYMLSQAAQEHDIKVVLTGEGSDELFVGYDSWRKILRLDQKLRRMPKGITRALAGVTYFLLSPFLDPASRNLEFLTRLKKGQPLFWGGAMDFCEADKTKLTGLEAQPKDYDTYAAIIQPIWEEYCQLRDPKDITGWMSYLDLKFRLPELMLPRVDKMGMARSIEGRVPFLDHRLIEYYLSLPQHIREASSEKGKGFFKEISAKELGKDFVYRQKTGFQAPVKRWKNDRFGKKYNPMLLDFARETSLFSQDQIEILLNKSNDRLYFSLINFMLWHKIFIERKDVSTL